MSDIIRLLPDSVANQIAAGEVIQRPASVIKELMENSLDAHATEVQVLVTDAGRTSIQVIDNGVGMSETDARLSFERHATSKIKEAADLFALTTMGFRGEALASIAAVAQVELRTRMATEEVGTSLHISGSKVESQEAVTCPVGAHFIVNNLFFNVPARRKFLKSNQTELSNILTEFERVALAHPEVSFSLSHNATEMLNLPASTSRQRVLNIFGKRLNAQLLDMAVATSLVTISGFVGVPESARKKGNHQYFFVNGRYMRHPYFHRAVMEPFLRLIPADESVSYFIFLTVDPTTIDVNIHPTKTEIKFENEQAIWQIIAATVKESLGKFNAAPSIDFDTEDMPDIPLYNKEENHETPQAPRVSYNPDYNPFKASSSYDRPKVDWEKLYEGAGHTASPAIPSVRPEEEMAEMPAPTNSGETSDEEDFRVTLSSYQYKGKYIITPVKSGLMIIHQQRAHVRILYDRYIKQMERDKGVSQGLLFPETFQLPASQAVILDGLIEDLSHLGFELSNLGGGSYAIQGVPSGIEGLSPVNLVEGMVQAATEKGGGMHEELHSRIALTLARSVAIVPGQVMDSEEMNNLIDNLFSCEIPNYTPDGKSTLHIITDGEIDRFFK